MRVRSFITHLCAVVLTGCVVPNAQVTEPAGGVGTTVTDVRVEELEGATRVVIVGDGPLNYTAFRLEDPVQLVVDLSETNWGEYLRQQDVESDPVTTLGAEQVGDDGRIARLTIGLSREAEFEIARADGGATLSVDILKTQMAGTPIDQSVASDVSPMSETADVTASEDTETEPLPMAATPTEPEGATKLTKVAIEAKKAFIEVGIEADGPLAAPKVFAIKNSRLVLDFPDISNGVGQSVINAETNTLVSRARIGQHLDPKKVRVVLDLKKAVAYTVTPQAAGVTVRLVKADGETDLGTAEAVAPAESAPTAPTQRFAPEFTVVEPQAPTTIGGEGFSGRKISLDFQDAEVPNVLRLLADVSHLNLVVSDAVQGKITLKLVNVPWDQVLDLILKTKGLGQVREGNIIRIDTNVNIAKQQDEASKAKEAHEKAEDLKTAIIPINYAAADDLSKTLQKNLTKRGEITVNAPTNSLIVKDVQQSILDMKEMIRLLDLPKPQVLIETRIVQANTNFARDIGVQWGATYQDSPGVNQTLNLDAGNFGTVFNQAPVFAVNLPASGNAGPVGNVGIQFGKFSAGTLLGLDLRLTAGEALGETKIISSPRVVTVDNKEAVIQQGDSIPYETISDQGTKTEFIDATLNLTVTPHITPNGSVIMKIKATKNAIGSFRSSGTGAPSISKREASTEVMVQDGETTVIGGIFETTKNDSMVAVPWFHKLPLVGWLFQRSSLSTTNQELLIFITPTIIKRA